MPSMPSLRSVLSVVNISNNNNSNNNTSHSYHSDGDDDDKLNDLADDDDDDHNNNNRNSDDNSDDSSDSDDEPLSASNQASMDMGAKRIQMLLAQYYGGNSGGADGNNGDNDGSNDHHHNDIDGGSGGSDTNNSKALHSAISTSDLTKPSTVFDPLNINSPHFNAQHYVRKTLEKRTLREVMDREKLLNSDIKRLDSELQTLVYENYNKFIMATDTIKKMKSHVESMEDEMARLMSNMDRISQCSEAISHNLSNKRQRIDKLSSVSRMLKKMQFLLELPKRLRTCLDMRAYPVAVKYYNMANRILNQYRHLPSFQSIHTDSEQVMNELRNDILYRIVKMLPPLSSTTTNGTATTATNGTTGDASSSSSLLPPSSIILSSSSTSNNNNNSNNNSNNSKTPLVVLTGNVNHQGKTGGGVFHEYRKSEDIEAVTLLLQLGEDWQQLRQVYTMTRKVFIDQVSRQLPSNTRNIREFIDQLNSHVINRAIDWIQVYFTAFHKLDTNEDYFVNWIGRDIFQSVYLTRAREHLVDTLVSSNKSFSNNVSSPSSSSLTNQSAGGLDSGGDDPASSVHLLNNTSLMPAQDFRHAMFQMWYQVTSRVHILIPEAKMSEKASNLVSDTVKAYMEYEMSKLRRSVLSRMIQLSRTSPSSVKQDSKEVSDLLSVTCTSIVDDVKIVASQFYALINNTKSSGSSGSGGSERIESPTDESFQVLVSRKQIFHTWIQTSIMRVIEDVCAEMSNRVMPHSQVRIHVNTEAEEASKLPELKQKKAIASIVASMKKQQFCTPAGLLLVCRLCRDLSRDHLKRMASYLEDKFPTKSKATLFDVAHLTTDLLTCGQQYLVGFIETQGQRLNKFIRTGIESHDWLNDSDVVRGVRHGIVSVVKEMSEIAEFVNRVFPAPTSTLSSSSSSSGSGSGSGSGSSKKEASSFSYASMNQNGQQDVMKDVMKIFNKKLSTFRITPPTLSITTEVPPSKILIEIIKIALKTFEECIRMCTFGKDGFQQLQVDAHFLSCMWSKLVNDDKVVISLVTEAMNSCAERCLEFSPLDKTIVQTLVDKKISQLAEKA